MTHVSLFSGIGGLDLAAEWAGFETVLFCEKDPYCQKVLARHWPGVPIVDDIRSVTVDKVSTFLYNRLSKDEAEVFDMAAKRKNYDTVVQMYDSGFSIGEVADYYGISRQAMWMILKRRGCTFRDKNKYGADNNFYRGGKSADERAHDVVEKAVEKGLLTRGKCETCGEAGVFTDGRSSVQAHHDDYNKPMEVRWLCQRCHHEWHKKNKPIEIQGGARESLGTIDVVSGGFP